MKKVIIYHAPHDVFQTLRSEIVEADPVCGQDFCDHCGDCLACEGAELCWDGSDHSWIEYREIQVESVTNETLSSGDL